MTTTGAHRKRQRVLFAVSHHGEDGEEELAHEAAKSAPGGVGGRPRLAWLPRVQSFPQHNVTYYLLQPSFSHENLQKLRITVYYRLLQPITALIQPSNLPKNRKKQNFTKVRDTIWATLGGCKIRVPGWFPGLGGLWTQVF